MAGKDEKTIREIGYVKPREITEEIQESYLDYAMSVIVSRALPDVRDGLKPVHRRILFAMNEMGLKHNVKFRKSATVVGECFVKDTLITTIKGLVPIQEIKIGDLVYTQNGIQKVTEFYEMPSKPLLRINLDNGLFNIATPSQQFKVLTPDWKFEWKEAKDLNKNDYLIMKADFPEIENLIKLKVSANNQPRFLNENIAYVLGFFVSEGSISKDYGKKKLPRISFSNSDRIIMEKIQLIFQEEFGYVPTVERSSIKNINLKFKDRYTIRINRKEINDFFIVNFQIENKRALTKEIPKHIFTSPKSVIFSFISGLIDGDGCVHNKKNMIHYGSISEKLINQLQILLLHQGMFSDKYKDISFKRRYIGNREVKKRYPFYYLEIKGDNSAKLASHLTLVGMDKRKRAFRIANKDFSSRERKGWYKYDLIPYGGRILFQELSNKHLGSGWYQNIDGGKFRMGIKYPDACKIRYSSDLWEKPLRKTQVIDWGIKEKLNRIGSPLFEFLDHIIQNKIYFLNIASIEKVEAEKTYDFQVENDHEFIANGIISHNCLGKFHPHGDMAVYDSLVRMAQDFSLRYPLIQGQGNFGCFTEDTKIRLTDGRSLIFEELIKEQQQGRQHWTFTFNHQTKKIEVAEIKKPRLTKRNQKIIEITLDNGDKIKCTPDHMFLLRDGNYKHAQDLKSQESLMRFSTDLLDQKTTSNLAVFGGLKLAQDSGSSTNYNYSKTKRFVKSFLNVFTKKNAVEVPGIEPGRPWLTIPVLDQPTPTADLSYHNHKIISIKILKKREDVYDLTCEPWNNFLLGAGIFVHNSQDGDRSASMRYTESRLSNIGEEILNDIEKETVSWMPNYDGTRKEPTVLPSPVPQLLLNGSLGIAVGMATNIPPHNAAEVLDASVYLIDHPDADTEDLFQFIQGPDFPTGGIIFGRKDIVFAYSQGKGPILCRGKAEIKEDQKGNFQILITEIPYQVEKSSLVQEFAHLVETKKIEGIKNIQDESDRQGMRIVIDLKKEAFPKKILNGLFKYSSLQKMFHLNMLALVDGIQPKVLSLVEVLNFYLLHKKEVVLRRTKFDLNRAKERAHILEGLMKALKNIDEVIATIKKSDSREDAKNNLIKRFKFTEMQAVAILETKLQNLARLERDKIENELKELEEKIKELEFILKSPAKVKEIMKKELKEMREKYGDERRTKVVAGAVGEIGEEELIPNTEALIMVTQGGYIKRAKPSLYKAQKRGGKGISGLEVSEEDMVEHFLVANTLDKLLFFTDSGKIFQCFVWEIPELSRVSKGRGLLNFLELSPSDKILKLISYSREDEKAEKYLVMATKSGTIKKTALSSFKNVRKNGLLAIKLETGDALCSARLTEKNDEVILVSKQGKSIRFKESDIRSMGRSAAGVRGMRLTKGDEVISMDVIENQKSKIKNQNENSKIKKYLLVITENGFGKRTKIEEYRLQKRGGSGIKAIKITPKTGNAVFSEIIGDEEEEIIVISKKGQVIRTALGSIRIIGRVSSGVKVMRLQTGDKIASAICL